MIRCSNGVIASLVYAVPVCALPGYALIVLLEKLHRSEIAGWFVFPVNEFTRDIEMSPQHGTVA
jgi:hypothetical protein